MSKASETREPIILNRAEGDFSTERRRQIPERPPKVRLAELADEEHRPQSFEKQHSREELGKKPIDNAELSVDDISREHHLSAEQVQIHRQELDAALNTLKNDESPSLQLRDEGFSGDHRLSALDVRPPPKNDVLDITKRIGSAEITDEKPEKFDEELDADGHQDITHSDFAKTAELKTADVAVIGEPSTTTAEPETAAEVLEDDDHFEQFGTRPEIVQPKLNNVIDEEPTPDLVTPSSPEVPEEVHEEITVAETTTTTTTEPSTITIPLATPELVTELVTEAFTEAPTTFEEFSTTVFPPPAIVDISTAVNRHRPVAGNAEFKSFGISKVIPKHSSKQKKSKGFGITGFLLQKSERKRFVHDGSVTKKSGYMPPKKFVHKAAPMKTAFLAKPATTAAPDISPDTLHALDWMLRNISKIAEEGDAAFVRALNFNSQETDNQRKTKLRKGLSKQRLLSKAKGTAIHSGEFKFKVSKTTFPKFRSRSTSASRARSFGVRTVSDDKALYQVTGVTTDQQKTANPSKLLEEIANLEAMMNSVERKVEQVVAKQPGIPESSPLERSDEFTDSAGPAEEIEAGLDQIFG
ncbi:hypothetical protein Q1695_010235 [Nippostrongylus brasiliensis]|nr:hypothetical protein Q1695_010235 [Nippostrongylus brasiliensis]